VTTFRQLLDQFDRSAATLPAKGRRFERFCREYFRSDPLWSDRFDEVWEWSDWPGRDNAPDTGVDLVARERGTGDLVAIQCKFYSPTASLDWRQVSTFAGMMGYPDFASGMIVSTAGRESANVHRNLDKVEKDVSIWRVDDFEESRVDWDHYELTDSTMELPFREGKSLRPHQAEAIADVVQGFATADRGQMIMACGTGKTFTSLRLAEQAVGVGGTVLFLVPSINLLSQSVQAWAADASVPLATFAVCSDAQAGRKADEDMSANDLAIPASTDVESLIRSFEARASRDRMSVVFSTYQSIDVITEAQAEGLARFDLIVCDEAHRTTGAIAAVEKQSAFTKVHFNENVDGARRLYMTATPRIYGDQAKAKASDRDVLVASMDDPSTFGEVFHELSFGDAVAQKLLSDYKVLVLAVNEGEVAASFQRQLASGGNELGLNDVARLVGVWHALSKRGPQFGDDAAPMQRAVSFTNTIKSSTQITDLFPKVVDQALERRSDANSVRVEGRHVDGKTNVKVRSEAIAWLEEPPGQGVCRMLSNARCLTEGVDIPALDAVVFMHPRKSLVDIVQAVGRVMRQVLQALRSHDERLAAEINRIDINGTSDKVVWRMARLAEDKELGYVILPVAVPAGVPPEQALSSHETYDVVWQVLQALRSHDERLAAEINRIDINGTSDKVNVIGVGVKGGDEVDGPGVTTTSSSVDGVQLQLPDLDEWRDALYARIVEKVGDRHYMADWADDIAQIAASQESRIRALLAHPDQNPEAVERFATFTEALRNNLNDSIGDEDAIGMLSQHLITRPVFEALFGHNQFIKSNPVSVVMDSMIATLDDANLATETASLEGFYEHIRGLIGGIDTPEGRQHVITELYEKFFRKALPKTVQALGIVYTPIEIVDFINRSVNDLLHTHFDGTTISDEGVHVLDPFTGTGTFISRLLQSGLIKPEDLDRKYRDELHANELVLFAYYIAAINIETTYNALR
jgi:predicted helicase